MYYYNNPIRRSMRASNARRESLWMKFEKLVEASKTDEVR